jgi:Xaa-Pro dipeptidase
MNRRDFLKTAGVALAGLALAPKFTRAWEIPLSGEIPPNAFANRIARARELMRAQQIDLLFAVPSRNMAYLSKLRTWRSERLIAYLLPLEGEPVIISPAFEEERLRRGTIVKNIATWQESEDPYALAADLFKKSNATRVGIEPSTDFGTYWKLRAAAAKIDYVDAGAIFADLRIKKDAQELAAIRRAAIITEEAIAAAQAQLAVGKTEQEILFVVNSEMEKRGGAPSGTVQFAADAALPHAGAGELRLERNMAVLMDMDCEVDGYYADMTRTIYWADTHSAKFKEIYNIVWQAQQAGAAAARAGVEAQSVDRAAREVIEKAGYGKFFTHRLGHGLGLDGHEPPYLVEGNRYKLEAGNVLTIEPGIYLPGEFGVRIEDDFLVTEKGVEALAKRAEMI